LVDPKKNRRGPPLQEDGGRSVVVVSTVPHLRMRGRVETPPPELGSIYRKDVTPPAKVDGNSLGASAKAYREHQAS
jgi:hypothetical protein